MAQSGSQDNGLEYAVPRHIMDGWLGSTVLSIKCVHTWREILSLFTVIKMDGLQPDGSRNGHSNAQTTLSKH